MLKEFARRILFGDLHQRLQKIHALEIALEVLQAERPGKEYQDTIKRLAEIRLEILG